MAATRLLQKLMYSLVITKCDIKTSRTATSVPKLDSCDAKLNVSNHYISRINLNLFVLVATES